MIAYHGREADKTAILEKLSAHRAADQLVQGYGYWKDGKGCAIGCTIGSGNHLEYPDRFGIPAHLAHLEDAIFEGLPVALARQWPERFSAAIRVGSDLTHVHWKFLHWLLTDEDVNPGINHPIVKDAVAACADLMAQAATGKAATAATAWTAVRAEAWTAAREAAAAAAARAAAAAAADRIIDAFLYAIEIEIADRNQHSRTP